VLTYKTKLTVWGTRRGISICYLCQVVSQCAGGKCAVCGGVEFSLSFVGGVSITATGVSASSCSRLSLNCLSEIHLSDTSQKTLRRHCKEQPVCVLKAVVDDVSVSGRRNCLCGLNATSGGLARRDRVVLVKLMIVHLVKKFCESFMT
jgi:hypothetical protein